MRLPGRPNKVNENHLKIIGIEYSDRFDNTMYIVFLPHDHMSYGIRVCASLCLYWYWSRSKTKLSGSMLSLSLSAGLLICPLLLWFRISYRMHDYVDDDDHDDYFAIYTVTMYCYFIWIFWSPAKCCQKRVPCHTVSIIIMHMYISNDTITRANRRHYIYKQKAHYKTTYHRS